MAYFTDTKGDLSSPVGSTFLCLMWTSYCAPKALERQDPNTRTGEADVRQGGKSQPMSMMAHALLDNKTLHAWLVPCNVKKTWTHEARASQAPFGQNSLALSFSYHRGR